jgi:hypothetical protein
MDGIVVAHDANKLHAREMACGGGEKRGRAAENFVSFAERSFDRIESDRSYYEERHSV